MHELLITGQPELHVYADYWNNRTAVFNLKDPHRELVIDSRLIVRTAPATLPRNAAAGRADLEADLRGNLQLIELRQPDAIAAQDQIAGIVAQIDQPWKGIAAMVSDAASYIFQHFGYTKGITHIETTVDEILAHRGGVCQDFAHVMLQLLRTMGIPSRYVSGYICPNRNGLRGVGATHAWVEAWIPGHGWAGIDPTNNVWVTDEHVPLAVGRNFSDCTPVKGTFKGPARQQLTVFVSVGYEDGHTFEEVNEVRVPSPASEKEAPPLPVDHQAQQ
jgi:transglutaminase-like putative cysteine protease